jgi:hypothetical protein
MFAASMGLLIGGVVLILQSPCWWPRGRAVQFPVGPQDVPPSGGSPAWPPPAGGAAPAHTGSVQRFPENSPYPGTPPSFSIMPLLAAHRALPRPGAAGHLGNAVLGEPRGVRVAALVDGEPRQDRRHAVVR